MSLAAGAKLGPYESVAPLGAGRMREDVPSSRCHLANETISKWQN